ncbi:MAG: PIG-L deacetylase family protein [Anaerolineaceae bacterium]
MKFKRMLVIAPHTDDAELGCGGTISRFLEEDIDMSVVAFSTAKESLPQGFPLETLQIEFLNSMNKLGVAKDNIQVFDYPVRKFSNYRQEILEKFIYLRESLSPDIVLVPSGSDVHQDHQVIFAESVRAFKKITLWGYELPWNQMNFSAQAFTIVSVENLKKKWSALQEYKSQIKLNRSYFNYEFIESLARVRGIQIGEQFAEAYEVIRFKW